jgi:hypothetical protein
MKPRSPEDLQDFGIVSVSRPDRSVLGTWKPILSHIKMEVRDKKKAGVESSPVSHMCHVSHVSHVGPKLMSWLLLLAFRD